MRYQLLDTLRGFSLVSMILFHACWDLVYLFGYDWPWYKGTPGYLWQQSICWMFILISGFCMGLKQEGRALPFAGKQGVAEENSSLQFAGKQGVAKENRSLWRDCKRGLVVLAAGILITIATLLFSPQTKIVFGVLFFLGVSMILTAMLRSPLRKIPPFIGMLCVGVLFFVLRNINDGNLGFEGIVLCHLPNFLYEQGLLATFFGFQDKNFFSTDYFSLIPWYFLFLAGYFLCRCFLGKNSSATLPGFFKKGIPIFEIIGQHSLPVYLLHQPVILLLLSFIL
ncbi:MAG: DUF1624 domain-containing protein [Acidaminococcaceae bacterium]|nr:DUF1624 domain-containing protein [Acidaminococcaceae bacterium]